MEKILVMAVLFCSFIIIDPARAEEGKPESGPVVAETHDFALERYKNIFELHHSEKVEPIPNWHKHLPRVAEDYRCPELRTDPVDESIKCPIKIMDW